MSQCYDDSVVCQGVLGSLEAVTFIVQRLFEANKTESIGEFRDTIMNVYVTYQLSIPDKVRKFICGANYNETVKGYVCAFAMGLYGEEPKENTRFEAFFYRVLPSGETTFNLKN